MKRRKRETVNSGTRRKTGRIGTGVPVIEGQKGAFLQTLAELPF
jgi:hypothetical protein